jgi:hypothetical protein
VHGRNITPAGLQFRKLYKWSSSHRTPFDRTSVRVWSHQISSREVGRAESKRPTRARLAPSKVSKETFARHGTLNEKQTRLYTKNNHCLEFKCNDLIITFDFILSLRRWLSYWLKNRKCIVRTYILKDSLTRNFEKFHVKVMWEFI